MNLKVVISGSFKKHLSELEFVVSKFKSQGIKVLGPLTTRPVDPKAEFVILSSDNPLLSNCKLEINYMRQIGISDFHYIYDLNGYIGYSVAAEMAYAKIKGIPIIMSEEIKVFSVDIPIEAHKVLRFIGREIISVNDISTYSIQRCQEKFLSKPEPISKSDRFILSSLVKGLLKNLAAS
jgi:hypothetical protein